MLALSGAAEQGAGWKGMTGQMWVLRKAHSAIPVHF